MSDSELVKKWTVNDDGTLTETSVSSMGDLENDSVYIIVDENLRKIFIWKGEQAPVRRKFISAKTAQQMRQEQYGMVYRIDSLDPGIEGKDFLTLFGGLPTSSQPESAPQRASEIVSRPVTKEAPTTKPVGSPRPAPVSTSTPRPSPSPTTYSKPTPRVNSTAAPAQAPKPRIVKETEVVVTRKVQATPATPLSEITEQLKNIEIPSNLEREIVIIGNTVYSVIKEHLQLFSKDIVKLEPMDDLPAGLFPASQYQVRLFIEKGRVQFVEMLREKTRSERDEFVDDMKQSLQNLSKMGL
ncbi:MAG: hypothetical protein KAT16_00515 [Candidatus Heimdallarchaeota archaeon]|nr:hypothetical protein [Candidatus Heimdallarchaeota archaeon]